LHYDFREVRCDCLVKILPVGAPRHVAEASILVLAEHLVLLNLVFCELKLAMYVFSILLAIKSILLKSMLVV
jgi:hypothetical protein